MPSSAPPVVPEFAAVLVMAGRGARFGGDVPKVHRELLGRPVWSWAAAALRSHPSCVDLVLVVGSGFEDLVRRGAAELGIEAKVVTGGARRQDSVRLGIQAVDESARVVAIHDAARPLLRLDDVSAVVAAVADGGCAVLAAPARDTVKRVDDQGRVLGTPPRAELWLAATPQTLRRQDALHLHEQAERDGVDVTDDAALAEAGGLTVRVVRGDPWNLKLTTAADLELVTTLLRSRQEESEMSDEGETARDVVAAWPRVGLGHDLHRLVEGRPLMLGGLEIPSERGTDGHSDGDVVLHALTDAILGACGEPDIGELFSPKDERWRGAASELFLREALRRATDWEFRVVHVDLVVIAERPRLSHWKERIRAAVASILALPVDRVGLQAKTAEGLGPIGEGRAIEARAVALLLHQPGTAGDPR